MNDKELLELAAKAAGIPVVACTCSDPKFPLAHDTAKSGKYGHWSPLTIDGDALRLAVALRLKITPGKHPGDGCTVESQRSGIASCTSFRDDKTEQMRHAVVRVAAEIGRAMQ